MKLFNSFLILFFCLFVTNVDYALSQEGDLETENMEEMLPVIPTPGPTISPSEQSKERDVSQELTFEEFVRQSGGRVGEGKPPSAHWLRKNIGIRKIKGTGGPDNDVPFCMYVYGKRDPSVCFDPDTREKIYERGMDKSVLDEIKRKYREQGLMK